MSQGLQFLLLAHDVADSTVHKRAAMLAAGGANVTVAGFRRCAEPISNIAGSAVVDFGRTHNGRFLRRILSVLRMILCLHLHRRLFDADVIIARNLEMLAIGVPGRRLGRSKPILVYECLDIHRLLLGKGLIGRNLRKLEGWLSRRAAVLLTSSPDFITEYFEPLSQVRLPVRLIENKPLALNAPPVLSDKPPTPPFVIGWFGIIRCRRSLDILTDLVTKSAGAVRLVIRGRPALDQFKDFHRQTSMTPGIDYLGPYQSPGDLAAIYAGVHFSWAIDLFEEGQNSAWLLPNRLYEGGLYGAVPLAQAGVATGRFLENLKIGVRLGEDLPAALNDFFAKLTPRHYRELAAAMAQVPRDKWVYKTEDCRELVAYLAALKPVTAGGS